MTHRIVSFAGLPFGEEWKYYCSPGSAIEPLGSWRNVLPGKFYINCVVTDSKAELSETSLELKMIVRLFRRFVAKAE